MTVFANARIESSPMNGCKQCEQLLSWIFGKADEISNMDPVDQAIEIRGHRSIYHYGADKLIDHFRTDHKKLPDEVKPG